MLYEMPGYPYLAVPLRQLSSITKLLAKIRLSFPQFSN